MASQQLKKTNYFSHDSSARNDEKILRLRIKHGAAGYGVYFMLLERLREETKYMSVKDYNTIAFDLRVDAALIKSVVENFGLFAFTDDGKCFYSESFSRRMGMKDTLSRQRSEGGKIGMKNRWAKKQEQSETEKQEETPAPVPRAAPIEPASPKEHARPAAPAPQGVDNKTCLARFFADTNRVSIETLMMNFGMKSDELPALRRLAMEVVSDWELTEKTHPDYTDWSSHLVATMRKKRNGQFAAENQKGKQTTTVPQKPPEASDYQYGGGFGGKDV